MKAFLEPSPTGVTLHLNVQPGASRSEFSGIYDGKLRIRLQAKAVEGAANKALIAYLAKFFQVSKSSVSLLRGEKSRQKTVFIEGDVKALEKAVAALINADP
jgi:uncharacterized protein (TIGR00251 family)